MWIILEKNEKHTPIHHLSSEKHLFPLEAQTVQNESVEVEFIFVRIQFINNDSFIPLILNMINFPESFIATA